MAANVQSLVQYWKNFDLPGLQKDLDFAATDLANRQDESEGSRKKLVELSRDFKKSTPEDVRRTVSPLLKSFQAEVDSLCRRSKAAEAAFLTVYKKVVEAPDPLPALEVCLSAQQRAMRTQDLEIENKQLRETLNDYNQEFKDVRNQEVTIKQLRERLKDLEEKNDTVNQVHAKEKELQRALVEKERQVQETQETLSRKLHEAERKITDLQSALECTQTELFDLKSRCDEHSHAKSEEMEIVLNDLERSNQRAACAEKEVSDLRDQLTSVKRSLKQPDLSDNSSDMDQSPVGILTRSSLEMELASKEKEIAQLVEDIQRLQTSITTLKETSASQIAQLQGMLSEKNQVIQRLEKQLDKQKDYMEIKQELCILKSMEFPNGERESRSPTNSPKPLEVLLLEKTKALQTENTSLKVANSDATKRLDHLERERQGLLDVLDRQKDLVSKLEMDLADVHNISMFCRGEGEGQPSGAAEFLEDITSALQNPRSPSSLMESSLNRQSDFSDPADTLLPIISSQRERFRQRNQELETENAGLVQELSGLRNALSGLKKDNLKLYEKIKFLQSYPSSHRAPAKDEMELRYSVQYEEQLDPFTTFSRRERQRKYMNLSPFEKITLSLGQTVLSNRLARTGALIYTFMLHCLVFLVLYKMAYTETCRRDMAADWHAKYAEHMQLVHGDHV